MKYVYIVITLMLLALPPGAINAASAGGGTRTSEPAGITTIAPLPASGPVNISNFASFLINTGLNLLFLIVGIAALLYIVWGGIQYIASNGDTKKAETGRNAVINGVIGVAIVASAYFLVNLGLGLGGWITGNGGADLPAGGAPLDIAPPNTGTGTTRL